ncbi:MlaC/ttg2D family ABC transporter substrate-binding protein [Parasphingopyxis lamellibrachiae]|uniref:Phospholipid transport system substrate-binding protein n=1 Tax=Parasphingopyxis lamellibrachiae TaxID=680125 RepID=A0A3D9FCK6_9SPHN|nr:ABC transporter substrate-binding protein [Parasphingopyxis lamellibrachiae]RED15535.1 phospholipid transport system substrate-binding protein [Parasphingopyxis lamellibrachiae]
MTRFTKLLLASAFSTAVFATPAAIAPAQAAVSQASPSAFVESLAADGLGVLRTGSASERRSRFRSLLGQHFAINRIGDRLIQRWRNDISANQYSAYQRALPGFILGTYADRLSAYARADVEVTNATQRGSTYLVQTRITNPGSRPVTAVWYLTRSGGSYKVYNMRVAGINLTLNQAQDFDSYVQRNGFDRLVRFMASRGA